jgi:hypothetical protein
MEMIHHRRQKLNQVVKMKHQKVMKGELSCTHSLAMQLSGAQRFVLDTYFYVD